MLLGEERKDRGRYPSAITLLLFAGGFDVSVRSVESFGFCRDQGAQCQSAFSDDHRQADILQSMANEHPNTSWFISSALDRCGRAVSSRFACGKHGAD